MRMSSSHLMSNSKYDHILPTGVRRKSSSLQLVLLSNFLARLEDVVVAVVVVVVHADAGRSAFAGSACKWNAIEFSDSTVVLPTSPKRKLLLSVTKPY